MKETLSPSFWRCYCYNNVKAVTHQDTIKELAPAKADSIIISHHLPLGQKLSFKTPQSLALTSMYILCMHERK